MKKYLLSVLFVILAVASMAAQSLVGAWRPQGSNDNANYVETEFLADGTIIQRNVSHEEMTDNNGITLKYDIVTVFSGKWGMANKKSKTYTTKYAPSSCKVGISYKFEGGTPEQREKMTKEIAPYFQQMKADIEEQTKSVSIPGSNGRFSILSLNGTTLRVKRADGQSTGHALTFTRVKK